MGVHAYTTYLRTHIISDSAHKDTVMPSTIPLSSSASPPPSTHAFRERKSTNKYTQKNNRYRDKLRMSEGYKLDVAKAQSANNTYISKAKAAFMRTKEAELRDLHDEDQCLARAEIRRCSRQHSILTMYAMK